MNHVTSKQLDPAVKFRGMDLTKLDGRLVRHVRNRKFYVISEADLVGCYVTFCLGGLAKAAYGPAQPRTWEQIARLYNLVPVKDPEL